MEPDTPEGHEPQEGKIVDDAQYQFVRGSHFQSRIHEEEKKDFQKLYQMQNKQCEELKIEIQKITAAFQSSKKLYQEMLNKVEEKRDQIKFESRTKIKELTDKIKDLTDQNQRLSKINANNSKVLQDAMKEMSQKIRQKEQQIKKYELESIELKDQIKETKLLLIEIQSSGGKKDQEINELKKKLSHAEKQNFQKIKEQSINLRQNEAKTKDFEEKLVKINQQNVAFQQKLQQTEKQSQKQQHSNQEQRTEIQKLNKLLKASEEKLEKLKSQTHQVFQRFDIGNKGKHYYGVLNIDQYKFTVINSQVIQNGKQLQILCKMFENKKLMGFKLLFRASNHNFDVKNNKQKYCGVAHTVLLVKTQYGKIIGGYTPLKWKMMKDYIEYDKHEKQINNRLQYIPFDKKIVEYKDETRIDRMPKTRKTIKQKAEINVENISKEKPKADYYAVDYLRQYVPQYVPEKTIEYVARERKAKQYQYIPVERQIIHYPEQPLKTELQAELQLNKSDKSFIFSVSNNHKLTLQSLKENSAIQNINDYGPIFCDGICIADKSNTKNKSSFLNLSPSQYAHPEYEGNDKESKIKFTGSQDGQFYTQQWQVHQVLFAQ